MKQVIQVKFLAATHNKAKRIKLWMKHGDCHINEFFFVDSSEYEAVRALRKFVCLHPEIVPLDCLYTWHKGELPNGDLVFMCVVAFQGV